MDPCWDLQPLGAEKSDLLRMIETGKPIGLERFTGITNSRCKIENEALYSAANYTDANPELLQMLYALSVDLNWRAKNIDDEEKARAFSLLSHRLHGFVEARNTEMWRLTGYPSLNIC